MYESHCLFTMGRICTHVVSPRPRGKIILAKGNQNFSPGMPKDYGNLLPEEATVCCEATTFQYYTKASLCPEANTFAPQGLISPKSQLLPGHMVTALTISWCARAQEAIT